MWKRALLASLVAGLIALPALAEGWIMITAEQTSATIGAPVMAGTTTPIQRGVQEVRVVARTNPAWIIFQVTPAQYSTSVLNGRMSELGFFLPANVPEIFRVYSSMNWIVQGEGGTSVVHVEQVSK